MSLEIERGVELQGITAAAVSPSHLFAGLNDTVRCYNRSDGVLERTFSPGRSVTQIEYVPVIDGLAVMSSGHCAVWGVKSRREILRFPTTSASALALAAAGNRARIIVASKRKLRWVTLTSESTGQIEQLVLNERPHAIALTPDGSKAICGVGSTFLVVDLDGRLVVELPVPITTSLWSSVAVHITAHDDLILCTVGNHGTLIAASGKQVRKRLTWDKAPLAVRTLDPFALILFHDRLELRDFLTGWLVASFPLKAPVGLTDDGVFWDKLGFGKAKYAISAEYTQALAETNAKQAISLATQLPHLSSDSIVVKLYRERAAELFSQGSYDDALALFAKFNVEIEEVIERINEQLDLFEQDRHVAPDENFRDDRSISDVASVFSARTSRVRYPLIDSFTEYLTKSRRRINIELANDKMDKAIATKQLQLIDTALFRCYLLSQSPLIASLVRLDNYCEPEVVKKALLSIGKWKELVTFLYGKNLHSEALELIRDHGSDQGIIEYLGRLSFNNLDLIERFAKTPIAQKPSLARQLLFDNDHVEAKKIYEFLQPINKTSAVEFLRHRIEAGNQEQVLHQALAMHYLSENEPDMLYRFLLSSRFYNAAELLRKVPNKLVRPRALLLGRMKKHDEAIKLYLSVEDFEAAKEYTDTTYLEDPIEGVTALKLLFDLTVTKFPGHLIELLNEQGHRLPLEYALPKLPNDLEIATIGSFLKNQCKSISVSANNTTLRAAVGRVYLAESTSELSDMTQTSQTITNMSTCTWCRKRLGQSVIGFTKNAVLHYGCLDAYKESTSDGYRNI